ncbi:MAG: phosphohistidine phosphatase SixA [Chloroherpetonaceae bacterium]|nr:phosphohistidine phosphatase SixA [Chloroherpetonaceae bacterium]MDW8437590.1 phosphohistidine phosphatase SixA [Chloroherpetonaceae bacterium]
MKLYVFRHAEAEDLGKNGVFLDEQRQLTEKGRADAKKMGAYLKQKQRKINLILHSPLLRAVQTAEILATEWGGELKAVSELSTDYGARTYLEVVGKHKNIEHLAIVAHQPTLTKLISTLVSGEHNAQFRFEPCSVALIRIGATLVGGELELLLSPNDLP